MLFILAIVVGFWLLYLLVLYTQQTRILYPGASGGEAIAPPADARVLERDIGEGSVYAWLLPPLAQSRGLVVHFHGNGERIEQWPSRLRPWREAGYWLLLPEYRGYGTAAGRPSATALVEDAVDLVQQAMATTGVPPEGLIYHGRSLGTAVAAQTGRRLEPAAWVLESGFSRLVELSRRMLVPDFLLHDRYDTLAAMAQSSAPVLILHGRDDGVIPYSHAQRLHAALPGSRLYPMDCGHNDCPDDTQAYWQAILGFVADSAR